MVTPSVATGPQRAQPAVGHERHRPEETLLWRLVREQHFPPVDRRQDAVRAPVGPDRRHDRDAPVGRLDPQRIGAMLAENGHDLAVPRVDAESDGHLRGTGRAQ
jgi:hypothetical protein